MDGLVTLNVKVIFCPMRFPSWPASLVILRALACLNCPANRFSFPTVPPVGVSVLAPDCFHVMNFPFLAMGSSCLDCLVMFWECFIMTDFSLNFLILDLESLRSNRSHIQTSNRSICLNGSYYQPYVQFVCRILSSPSPLSWCNFSYE